jgi:hypothetical protein
MVQMYFPNFQVIPTLWENYVWHAERLMKEGWEVDSLIENREAVDPLVISPEETSEWETDSDNWPDPLW